MTGTFLYPADISQDEERFYLITFPDVPEAGTDDRNRSAAIGQALDCLACALEGYIKAGRPLPRPSAVRPGQVAVTLPPMMAAKAALYMAMLEAGVTDVALADRLGVSEGAVRRLLDLRHRSRIEALEAALGVLGLRLVIGIDRAA